MSLKIKHLSRLIQNYARRIFDQVVRQAQLTNTEQPARVIENATHVSTTEPFLLRLELPSEPYRLNMALTGLYFYERLEVSHGRGELYALILPRLFCL